MIALKLKKLLKRIFFPLVLITLVGYLSYINYQPHTFLTGWDTLHPEFNFTLNFKRLLNLWHFEQGLGSLPGHSQIADLPRVLILWLFNFILPLNTLRYSYVFFCLLLGGIGIFYLIQELIPQKYPQALVAFLTSIFYLVNPGTLQQFYVPFEMFTTQYAFLPWIILFSLRFLKYVNKVDMFFLAVVTLFATPQAYAAQLWYTFFLTYNLFLFIYWFTHRNKPIFLRLIALLLVIIAINAYWLLPNLYFIKTSSHIPHQSKQNRLFSSEYRLRNQENGYLKDVALGKGFYFNWKVYDFNKQKFINLMEDWQDHLNNPFIKLIGYSCFIISLLGLFITVKQRLKEYYGLIPFFVVPFIFLMNHTPPFEQLFNWLTRFELFQEGLRFVFTKFSILLIFGYSMFFALGINKILLKLNQKKVVFVILTTLLLFIYGQPIFLGSLISNKVKVKIPQEYFQLYTFMNRQNDGVILTLPIHNFAGWQYYNWHYQGSGFLWFGLKQPVLDRDFDRWSIANEQAYREFHYSLYSKNAAYFANNLKKFGINYIVWDKNNIPSEIKNQSQLIFKNETKAVLEKLHSANIIQKLATFGQIEVYETNIKHQNYFSALEINPQYRWTFFDYAAYFYGNYYTKTTNNNTGIVFKYRNLIDFNDQIKPQFSYLLIKAEKEKQTVLLTASDLYQANNKNKDIKYHEDIFNQWIAFNGLHQDENLNINLDHLPHQQAYILTIVSKNIKGLPLRICLKNNYSYLCNINDETLKTTDFEYQHFLIPPLDENTGYTLTLNNYSYGHYPSVNYLKEIVFTPIPVELFTERKVNSLNTEKIYSNWQTFHPGWKAYWGKQELKNKVLVNNWANGWILPANSDEKQIILIFWPQYLVYLGFGLIIITFITIVIRFKNNK